MLILVLRTGSLELNGDPRPESRTEKFYYSKHSLKDFFSIKNKSYGTKRIGA